MKNGKQISYALCGAIALWLCASTNAEEVVTHSLTASEKILLMETINVTSNKEVAEEDSTSGDPEVDQILSLVESVTLLSEDLNEDNSSATSKETSGKDSAKSIESKPNTGSNEKTPSSEKLDLEETKQTKTKKLVSDEPTKQKSK